MALILNIDTSTKNCSVCLATNGKTVAIKEELDAFNHAGHLTIFIHQLLQAHHISFSDLDAVAISEGPGSYTGLRIGASVAKGVCYGQNIPLLAVSTLYGLAHQLKEKYPAASHFVTIMDSRKDELYLAIYDNNLREILTQKPINVKNINHINIPMSDRVVAGTGFNKIKSTMLTANAIVDKGLKFSSLNIAYKSFINFKNKAFKNLIYFEPLYLKSVFVRQSNSLPLNE